MRQSHRKVSAKESADDIKAGLRTEAPPQINSMETTYNKYIKLNNTFILALLLIVTNLFLGVQLGISVTSEQVSKGSASATPAQVAKVTSVSSETEDTKTKDSLLKRTVGQIKNWWNPPRIEPSSPPVTALKPPDPEESLSLKRRANIWLFGPEVKKPEHKPTKWLEIIFTIIGIALFGLVVAGKKMLGSDIDSNTEYDPVVIEGTQYVIKEPWGEFPRNLVHFHKYDGGKFFAVFLFLFAAYFFLKMTFAPAGEWWQVWKIITVPILFLASLCGLIFSYLLLWVTFDRNNAQSYALSVISVMFGVFYILSPIDLIPEAIPTVGMLDDVVIGGGSIALATITWMKQQMRNRNLTDVRSALRKGDTGAALTILLKERGYMAEKHSTAEMPQEKIRTQSEGR